MEKHIAVSHDIIDRYISGDASVEEIALVTKAMKLDSDFAALVGLLDNMKESGELAPEGTEIPMASMAAMSEGNLCDVMCEQYILKSYLGNEYQDDSLEVALDNCWLKESGVPLHNMGRLLENHGLSVTRKYDCKIDELKAYLVSRCKVIAVVDYGQLWNHVSDGVFHAVVCLGIESGGIRLFDPAINAPVVYDFDSFISAWDYSRNYLVCASVEGLEYHPHPIDVSDVDLNDDLMELSEAIAENAHEIWTLKRKNEGWTYGRKRNDDLKQNPDMVPYSDLPEKEKYYDRDIAMNTIRLVKKLGFRIERKYTIYCSACGEFVSDSMKYCPNCGKPIISE